MTKEEIWNNISKLSELRSEYSCFDEKEEPFYHALSLGIKGIKALEHEEVLDKIRAEIEALPKTYPFINHIDTYVKEDDVKKIIDKYRKELSKE